MAVSLSQHMREGLIAVINTFNSLVYGMLAPATVNTRWFGAGYITGSNKQIRFVLPLNRVMTGSDFITVNSMTLYIRPHNGTNFITLRYGTDFTLNDNQIVACGIRFIVVLNNALSTIPNNSVVGIDAELNFSWNKPA